MPFIADASITLAWLLPDERDAKAMPIFDRTLIDTVVVPFHWRSEVANGLLMAERGRIGPEASARLALKVADFDLDVDVEGGIAALDRILPLARAHGLTIYDALYLELAERRGLELASLDGELVAAARKVGVRVLP